MKSKGFVGVLAVVFLFVVCTCPVFAQKPAAKAGGASHPLEGTWKLNTALSKFAPNHATAPKEETMVFRVVGDNLELTTTGTQKDGAPISGKYLFPKNGGEFKALQPAPAAGESSVETVIEPGNRFLTSLKNGKQVEVQRLVINRDGKTMTITDKNTDAQGKPYESVAFWEKQ